MCKAHFCTARPGRRHIGQDGALWLFKVILEVAYRLSLTLNKLFKVRERRYATSCWSSIVTTCLSYIVSHNYVRNKRFFASSVKDVFDKIEAQKIIDFIKETRFYKQL